MSLAAIPGPAVAPGPDWAGAVIGALFFIVLPAACCAVEAAVAAYRRTHAPDRGRRLSRDERSAWRRLSFLLACGEEEVPGGR